MFWDGRQNLPDSITHKSIYRRTQIDRQVTSNNECSINYYHFESKLVFSHKRANRPTGLCTYIVVAMGYEYFDPDWLLEMILKGWESNTSVQQKSTKLEWGNLSLGVQVPHPLYFKTLNSEGMWGWHSLYYACQPGQGNGGGCLVLFLKCSANLPSCATTSVP